MSEQELRAFITLFDKDEEQVQFVGYVLIDNLLNLLAKRAIELNATQGHVRWFDMLVSNQQRELTKTRQALGDRQEYAYF